MLYKIMSKDDYGSFVDKLISEFKLIGPKKKDKSVHDFVHIKNSNELDTGYQRTTIPPAKKILFPSSEELINYEIGKDIKITSTIKSEELILFGINAWDINGMNFMDRIFTTDFIDNNYVEKRKKLIVIGTDSEPTESNFAPAVNAHYAREGFDLYLTDLGEKYFIRIATERGNELINDFTKAEKAKEEDFTEYNRYLDEYRSKFKVKVDFNNLHDNFESVYDNEDFWKEISKNCYSCGSCNLVCPTCFCFNVKDDMHLNLKDGVKSREWDSCMIPEYGLVAGGHNFRPSSANRLKQRYRCKLKTFIDKFDKYACVGCGRCVDACLAKINIYEDINSIKKEVKI